MIVECAFGRLASRFRIFHRPIETTLETTDLIVKAACALHNFLTKELSHVPREDEICQIDTAGFDSVGSQFIYCNKSASTSRQNVVQYLMTDGNTETQWSKIMI